MQIALVKLVDDVKVDGVSVVTNKIANIDLSGKVDKVSSSDRVYGTDSQGHQTTYNKNDFGKVDDVKVNGTSVVTNKIANVTVPVDVGDLNNDVGYQTAQDVATAIGTHNVDPEAHQDIRDLIVALTDFTADTIVPTTTNFVPGTTYTVEQAFQRTANLFGGFQGEIDDINALIPNQATTQNQLADKAFVNATIATNAANFRGNWATWADVPTTANEYPEDYTGSRTPTNNDYMVVDDASDYVNPSSLIHQFTVSNASEAFTISFVDESGVEHKYYYSSYTSHWEPINETYSLRYVAGSPGIWYIRTNKSTDTHIVVNGIDYEVDPSGTTLDAGVVLWNTNWTNPTTGGLPSQAGEYQGSWRFIYVGDWATNSKNGWHPQYQIGTAFTQAQQAAIDSGITAEMVENYVNPVSTASTAYNSRITALETDKVDKIYTANKVYGTNSIGAQIGYIAGDNIEFSTDGKINVINVQQQVFVMPEATAERVGQIVQYMGETNATYTHGVLYQCVPVYGDLSVSVSPSTSPIASSIAIDQAIFKQSSAYQEGTPSYDFTCTRTGLSQRWTLPNGSTWMGSLGRAFGITYLGRPAVGDVVTVSQVLTGYTWEAYAGVSSGNDKIDIIGDKVYGVNVVPQYNQRTLPDPTHDNVGMICQFRGDSNLLTPYQDGYFYQVREIKGFRDYSLSADPAERFSDLYISDYEAITRWFSEYDGDDVTFVYVDAMTGWTSPDILIMSGSTDLTTYGITYTLAAGQTLTRDDKIIVHIIKTYHWENIPVQPDKFMVSILPEPTESDAGRVVFYANGLLENNGPVPDNLSVEGKWYRCESIYDEGTGEFTYEWKPLPYQFSLAQYKEMPDPSLLDDSWIGAIVQYVGEDTEDYTNGIMYKLLREAISPSSITTTVHVGNFFVAVEKSTFESYFGTYRDVDLYFIYSNGGWLLDSSYVNIADWGISIIGTPAEGNAFEVMYTPAVIEYQWKPVSSGDYLLQVLEMPEYQDGLTVQYVGARWQEIDGVEIIPGHIYRCQRNLLDVYRWYDVYNYDLEFDQIWSALDEKIDKYYEFPDFEDDEYLGLIAQYIGETTEDYVNGYFYEYSIDEIISEMHIETSITGGLTIEIDDQTFIDYMEAGSEDIYLEFFYSDSEGAWTNNGGEVVDLADYGITVTGTPSNNDLIQVWYYAEQHTWMWKQKDVQPGNIQKTEFPELKGSDIGRILQYVGESSDDFKNGYFYKSIPTIYPTRDESDQVELSIAYQDVFEEFIYDIEAEYSTRVYAVNATLGSSMSNIVLAFLDKDENVIFSQEYQDSEVIDNVGLSISGDMSVQYNITAELVSYWKQHNVQDRDQTNDLPDPNEVPHGRIMQYAGETTEDYVNGYFYQTVLDETTPSSLNAEQEGPTLDLALNVTMFEEMQGFPTQDMVITLTYDGTNWYKDGELVDLLWYGITITSGTPDSTSIITLYYYAQPYIWKVKSVQSIEYDSITKSLIFD